MDRHSHDENDPGFNSQRPPHAKENAPPGLSEWHSESSKGKGAQGKGALQGKLDALNAELRYSGAGELRVCLCEGSGLDSLAEV